MPTSNAVAPVVANGKCDEVSGGALSNYGAGGAPALIMLDQVSGNVTAQSCRTLDARSANLAKQSRSYVLDEATGRYERIIRKRMRKTATQLSELVTVFEADPRWSKETLYHIAMKTGLTEAQVYKWGWDHKRKKFGVVEAEKMRKYENILDQQNAKKAVNQQLAFADVAATAVAARPHLQSMTCS